MPIFFPESVKIIKHAFLKNILLHKDNNITPRKIKKNSIASSNIPFKIFKFPLLSQEFLSLCVCVCFELASCYFFFLQTI